VVEEERRRFNQPAASALVDEATADRTEGVDVGGRSGADTANSPP
jgi:hypothetical protein